MPAWSYPVCMHASVGRTHSTAMRAMILACMERTVECDWRKRGWGLGEPTHIRSMRWNGDSTLFAAVRYYRCIPQRTTRGSNGLRTVVHTPTARLPPKCRRLRGKLEAARGQSGKEEAAPPHLHAARQCVRACATSDAGTNLRPGSRVRHARASRARRCPMDATRRLASRPRHVRDGTARRMRARHPTRNRVYTLAASRHRLLLKFRLKYAPSSTNVLCPVLKHTGTVPNVLCPIFGLFWFLDRGGWRWTLVLIRLRGGPSPRSRD